MEFVNIDVVDTKFLVFSYEVAFQFWDNLYSPYIGLSLF